MEYVELTLNGISKKELDFLKKNLGKDIPVEVKPPKIRSGIEILSAAFILGILKVTPDILKAILELIREANKTKHISIKLASDDGRIVIEGLASKGKLEELTEEFNKMEKNYVAIFKEKGSKET